MANVVSISATAAEIEEKQAITAGRKMGSHDFRSEIAAPPSAAPEGLGIGESGEEEVMESNHRQHHHRSFEKSAAGGGAVVGVLAAVFLTAVFCYIRATRRRPPVQPGSPTDSASSERKMIESRSPEVVVK